jgi:hypothetical protein
LCWLWLICAIDCLHEASETCGNGKTGSNVDSMTVSPDDATVFLIGDRKLLIVPVR